MVKLRLKMTLFTSQSASEAEPGLLSRPPAPNNGDNTMRKANMDLAGRDLTGTPHSPGSGRGSLLPSELLLAGFTLVSAPSAKCDCLSFSRLILEPTPRHLHPQPKERDWSPSLKQGNTVFSMEANRRG